MSAAKHVLLCNSEMSVFAAGQVIKRLECASPNVQNMLGSSNIENSLKLRCYFLLLLQSSTC